MFAAENSARMAGIKDELTIAVGNSVTPGVDDTEYIQYALNALTGDQGTSSGQRFYSGTTNTTDEHSEGYPQPRRPQDNSMGYTPITPPERAFVDDRIPMPEDNHLPERYMAEESTPETVIHHNNPNPRRQSVRPASSVELDEARWIYADKHQRDQADPRGRKYPPLTYKPAILRPFSMLILMTLCLLMIVGLIFSTVYSSQHDGLTPYPGSIYSGQYFVFRILPQLLAAIILILSQSIVVASLRILPFTALASEYPEERKMALFQNLYQKTFFVPRLIGPWQFKIFSITTWLMIFTIPLQSTAFTCVFDEEKWIWAAVQGVCWVLAVLYLFQLVATAILMTYWFKRWTGLIWDIRSIADLLPLLYQSNTLGSYEGMDTVPSHHFPTDIQERYYDRLGYWGTDDERRGGAIWYTLGTSAADDEAIPIIMGKRPTTSQTSSDRPHEFEANAAYVRYRYMPRPIQNLTLIFAAFIMAGVLITILTLSFIKSTRLDEGFLPQLSARPGKGAFSAANFLYGFIPSLLGMVFFLLFQSVDHALRVYRPWQELNDSHGTVARKSLLADYAACLPFQSAWKAARNGHWRTAIVSLMAVLFVSIPILAGGLFMALTNSEREVRMFPNMPVFGVLLAFLFLYFGCLVMMIPRRRFLRMPHPAETIAEIISFCAADETVHDAAFRAVRSRADLEDRLGLHRSDPREETLWYFGVWAGRDEKRLSVRPMARLTEKSSRSRRSTGVMI